MAQDQQLALMHYEKAAQQGHSGSQFNAGNHYRDGRGCHQSFERAAEWFEKAARQGNPDAMTNLGFLYQNGQGVLQSSERATELWEKAGLERGRLAKSLNARVKLEPAPAAIYIQAASAPVHVQATVATNTGFYTPPARKAVTAVHKDANALGLENRFDSGLCTYIEIKDMIDASRPGVDPRTPWPALSDTQQSKMDQAVAMLKAAAGQGHMRAQALCGDMYRFGGGVAQDEQLAFMYYETAAQMGHDGSQFNTGNQYRDGRGCTQSYERASEWFEKAARQGNPGAMTNLGFLYQNGQGVLQSYEQAAEWYEKAAQRGDAYAMNSLASLHENGQGVPQNYKRAADYFAKAQRLFGERVART